MQIRKNQLLKFSFLFEIGVGKNWHWLRPRKYSISCYLKETHEEKHRNVLSKTKNMQKNCFCIKNITKRYKIKLHHTITVKSHGAILAIVSMETWTRPLQKKETEQCKSLDGRVENPSIKFHNSQESIFMQIVVCGFETFRLQRTIRTTRHVISMFTAETKLQPQNVCDLNNTKLSILAWI